ncbi:hypothetical protein WOLCODRAFT_138935 [Wolfiporia cocos MD-104 SS10]|uniref:Uncharacterized protein n=1 Tax=Wolfiporia cocos (strain MD-104) TaxID=742152 RepID=A0A2H3JZJ3_WOLCO|nr:hypothetical protein WOLCODRAFT_138935 [Wolfiporia cocos MD-104 SS10]
MKGISLHPRTHSAPSNSSTPSSRAASAINGEAAPQPKGVRKLVKKLQGGIRHISHIGHHPKAAAISAVPVRDQSVVASIPPSHTPVDSIVGIVHDIPALPIAFPLYPKSKTSFDSMSASTLTSEGEPADVTDAHSFDAHSVDRPSSFTSAADHLSIHDSSSVHSASVDASSAYVSAVGDSSTPALLDSVAALSPQPAPGDNMIPPQPNLPEAELDQPVAPEDDEPTAAPETAAPEASQPAESDSPEPSESPDPVVPMPPEEERASTLDDSKFDASESEDKEEGTMEVDSSPHSEEPEVPDPFLVDEPEDSPSEEPEAAEEVAEEPTGLQVDIRPSLAAADEVSLVQPSDASEEPPPALPADVNKDVPPPPPQLVSDEEEEEAPELYLPGLTLPTMFLPIPNVRSLLFCSLNWWLARNRIIYYPYTSRRTR